MFEVVSKERVAENVEVIKLRANDISLTARPGQFVMLRVDADGERIPLSIADKDEKNGTISLIFERKGKTTSKLACIGNGGFIRDVVGPLGKPFALENWNSILLICTSIGLSTTNFLLKALSLTDAEVNVLTENRFVEFFSNRFPVKVGALSRVDLNAIGADKVFIDADFELERSITNLMKKRSISTTVFLHPMMLCGFGICGSCRVRVSNQVVLACKDGPSFNAKDVDFDDLSSRVRMFSEYEKVSMDKFKRDICGR